MVNPCECGHEKGDHVQRIGQRGNYTPCNRDGCKCDGFKKKKPSRPDDFDRLPERFQKYIRDLELEVSRLKEAQPVKEKTNVRLVDYLSKEGGTFLPNDAKVEFECAPGCTYLVQIAPVKHGFVGVEVMSTNGVGFNILPRAANSVIIAGDELARRPK